MAAEQYVQPHVYIYKHLVIDTGITVSFHWILLVSFQPLLFFLDHCTIIPFLHDVQIVITV